MELIINPLWFYLIDIDIVDNINLICMIILIIAIIALCAIAICAVSVIVSDIIGEDEKQAYFKYIKISLKVIIPCIILTILTLSSGTIYKMIIADNITPHNIEVVGDTIEGGIDYIFEKINLLTLDEVEKDEG